MASAADATMCADQFPPAELHRRPVDYQPKTWDYDSIYSLQQQAHQDDKQTKQSSLQTSLKQRVRHLLLEEEEELATRLMIMDQLQSLGVAYHFEEEIRSVLVSMHVHDAHLQLKHDLSSTALLFRMLRGHGIPASTDMLTAFRDDSGDFKAANPKDIDAFIALHEASYLAFPGEAVLDDARAFTIKKLEELMPSMSNSMGPASQTERQGDLPLHWRVPRLQAIWSLKQHAYNDERHLSMAPSILQLAAVDFNLVQAVHGAELVEVTKWWKEKGWEISCRSRGTGWWSVSSARRASRRSPASPAAARCSPRWAPSSSTSTTSTTSMARSTNWLCLPMLWAAAGSGTTML